MGEVYTGVDIVKLDAIAAALALAEGSKLALTDADLAAAGLSLADARALLAPLGINLDKTTAAGLKADLANIRQYIAGDFSAFLLAQAARAQTGTELAGALVNLQQMDVAAARRIVEPRTEHPRRHAEMVQARCADRLSFICRQPHCSSSRFVVVPTN